MSPKVWKNCSKVWISGQGGQFEGCDFFLLNPRAVFTQATSSHAEARSPRFVRGLAAGFAALRAFPSKAALSSAHFRPASLDLGLAFRWPISRARRQMRGDRIKCLGLRTYRTSCINATDSICRRARMESQSVVKLGQWARVDDKPNRSRSACGNATCGTFQHFRIAPHLVALSLLQCLRRSTQTMGRS